MKSIALALLIGAFSVGLPGTSQAQARVHVIVSVGHDHGRRYGYGYNTGYRYNDWHREVRCPAYSRYGCYSARAVRVHRDVRPLRVVVVSPRYGHVYRHR